MPIISPHPYSEENVQWSMYKIADSKWQPQPPTEEEDFVGLPKYKKYTQHWVIRIITIILHSYTGFRNAFAQRFTEVAEEYKPSQITSQLLRTSQMLEQELEQTRLEETHLEEARLVWNRFQELIALSRRPPSY